jgi:zinc/manganese transport system substrate-binding protein
MKLNRMSFKWLVTFTVILCCFFPQTSRATLNIFATVPEWGALAQMLGKDKVKVFIATTALQDPHQIQARPSLLARARTTDLLIATGADLEAGWLPVLQRDAGNPKILPGQLGMLEAASYVQVLDINSAPDRSMGHVHASGNPHIQTDARNFMPIARAMTERLIILDPQNTTHYQEQLQIFLTTWSKNIERWQSQARPLIGAKVWVQHDAFRYMNEWLGLDQVGVLEIVPGVDPSVTQLSTILKKQSEINAKMVLSPVYLNQNATKWLSEKANIPSVILPFTVGGNNESRTLETLFDDTIRRLLQAWNRG